MQKNKFQKLEFYNNVINAGDEDLFQPVGQYHIEATRIHYIPYISWHQMSLLWNNPIYNAFHLCIIGQTTRLDKHISSFSAENTGNDTVCIDSPHDSLLIGSALLYN